ncbi:Zn-binding Pro-Ala-Ala-Arg (PAAR) domain-containing protein, incolved in TypeVI secretion [Pseudomonas sp. 8AS]|nr:Zn-binding Pro-Ala-Ala-Arg (PAAR) domain-containing protein, incolved in TypeVI secretion [Pseudomonas sp. 8AS]
MSGKPAARQTDPTSCPVPGHGTNPIATGSPNVFFDNLPAARMSDTSACGSPIVGAVASTVLINGLPAATLGSTGGHGNVIIGGSGSVIIGDSPVTAPFTAPTPLALTAAAVPVAAPTSQPLATPPAVQPTQPAAPMDQPAPAIDRAAAAEKILDDLECSITKERVFNDRDYPMGSPGDPFEKQQIIEQLRVRVARAHGRSTTSQIRLPAYPDQDRTSLCGPAAFFYALLMDRPDLYTRSIIELWEKGETTIGRLHIKPSHACCNPKDFSKSAPGDRIPPIDWISLASLRDSENELLSYDSPDDKAAGITFPGALESLFVKAGASVVFDNVQLGSISIDRLLELLGFVSSTHHVVSLVNAAMVDAAGVSGKTTGLCGRVLQKHQMVSSHLPHRRNRKSPIPTFSHGAW